MKTYFTKENDKRNVILFLHGWGCDGSVFAPLTEKMYHSTNLVIDLWGFGKSEKPQKEGMSVFDYAKELRFFLQEQKIGVCSIVCHSFGARVAIPFAAENPDMVDRLVIICGAGLRRFSLSRYVKEKIYKLDKRGKRKNYGSRDYKLADESMRNTLVKAVNCDLSGYASKIECPTLLLYGKKDDDTPIWIAKRLHRLIKRSTLKLYENGGHFLFLQYRDEIKDSIEAFLID